MVATEYWAPRKGAVFVLCSRLVVVLFLGGMITDGLTRDNNTHWLVTPLPIVLVVGLLWLAQRTVPVMLRASSDKVEVYSLFGLFWDRPFEAVDVSNAVHRSDLVHRLEKARRNEQGESRSLLRRGWENWISTSLRAHLLHVLGAATPDRESNAEHVAK